MFHIIKSIFPKYAIKREYSPWWLDGKRLDIFISEINLAVEYQGKQHFEAIDVFGGENGLTATRKRDETKERQCRANNIDIIYFDYTQKINEEIVRVALHKYL